jgi:AcrR family transcriptional regulator
MGVKERREREKEELRQEILDAAREMFAKEGFANVSMRKIADKIEYSPTTIYLYFKDKTDLLNQITEESFAKLGQRINEITSRIEDPYFSLREGMRAYIHFGLKHPHHYEVAFITPIMDYLEEDAKPFEGSMGQRTFEYLREGVIKAMKAEQIKQGDVDLISQTLWSGIHGITSLLIGHKGFPFVEKEKLIDSVVDTMLAGLKT